MGRDGSACAGAGTERKRSPMPEVSTSRHPFHIAPIDEQAARVLLRDLAVARLGQRAPGRNLPNDAVRKAVLQYRKDLARNASRPALRAFRNRETGSFPGCNRQIAVAVAMATLALRKRACVCRGSSCGSRETSHANTNASAKFAHPSQKRRRVLLMADRVDIRRPWTCQGLPSRLSAHRTFVARSAAISMAGAVSKEKGASGSPSRSP
jgi:hypothetical protein